MISQKKGEEEIDLIPNFESLGKILLITGALFIAGGLLFLLINRLGLGRLPGDIIIRRENFVFYFPIVTTLLLSVALTLLVNLIRRLF